MGKEKSQGYLKSFKEFTVLSVAAEKLRENGNNGAIVASFRVRVPHPVQFRVYQNGRG